MIQVVYVLEIVWATGVVRGHFAQTLGAAQRAAAGKFGLSGAWVRSEGPVASLLLDEQGNELARVLRETLEYA